MTLYVALDIGCLHCNAESAVLGIFETEAEAKAVCAEHKTRYDDPDGEWISALHDYVVIPVPEIGVVYRREYTNNR